MRRILVVEDDRFVCDTIKTAFFLKGGFDVAYGGDDETALSELARVSPDLALIDFALPKVSGTTIGERAADIPVILMSGYADVIARSRQFRFPVLAKPFRVCELVERFDQVVAEARRLTKGTQQVVETSGLPIAEARASNGSFSDEWLRICDRMLLTR